MVGVGNDAVNFLNSAIGSRVATRAVILSVASLGVLAGVGFSSGMMEVARKGIFHPQYFTMPERMVIYLAVMLTDISLRDLYNTYDLPTSTTSLERGWGRGSLRRRPPRASRPPSDRALFRDQAREIDPAHLPRVRVG